MGEGQKFLEKVVSRTNPDFLIAPHPLDPHPDHSSAASIAEKVAIENGLPLYYMDTISIKEIEETGRRTICSPESP